MPQRRPWLRRTLAPPRGGGAKTSAMRLTYWLIVALLLANTASILVLIVLVPSQTVRFLVLLAAIVTVSLVAFFLEQGGHVVTAGWLLVVGFWAAALGSAWTAGGTTNAAVAALLTLVAIGGVLLGWRIGLALAVVAVGTVFLLAAVESAGWLPVPAFVQTPWVRAIWLSDFIATMTVAVVIFVQELTGARDRAVTGLSEVERSERAVRAVMDNAPFGAHMYHLEGDRLVFDGYNRKAAEMLGIDHGPLIGKTLEEAFPGNLGTDTPEAYRGVAREGGVYDVDQYAYDAEGITGIFEIHAFNSGPERVSVFFRDITEKRLAEFALRDANAMLAVAQRAASAGFWSWDIPAGRLMWTPEFYALFGLSQDAGASFDTWRGVVHPDDVEAAEARITESVERHVPLDSEYRIVRPDGEVRWIGATGTTEYMDDGSPRRMSGICLDISEAKRREQEIVALNAELELRVDERTRELSLANRELQDFVYSASHDLRQPLRALDGFSEILLEDCADVLDAQHVGHLHRIRAASQHMAELIDALLALSRVGRREVVLELVDVSAAAWSVINELRESAPDRRVSVLIEDGVLARTDAALADIVLRNLLGNAWKFTAREAEAVIEVGEVREHGRVMFFVRDNGAGFDPEHMTAMFRPFHRLHTQEEFPGTGIGLATVQRALDKLGGDCRAQGVPGEGATFYFTLG